jgi:hypothetical protein
MTIQPSTPRQREELSRLVLALDGINDGFAGSTPHPGSNATAMAHVSIDDYATLLDAVVARLKATVVSSIEQPHNGALRKLQSEVLECADALHQLHAAQRQALGESIQATVTAHAGDRPAPQSP